MEEEQRATEYHRVEGSASPWSELGGQDMSPSAIELTAERIQRRNLVGVTIMLVLVLLLSVTKVLFADKER